MMSLIWGYNVEGVKKRLQKKNERRYNSILYKKWSLKSQGGLIYVLSRLFQKLSLYMNKA